MKNVVEIMDMLDWNMPLEVQSQGRLLAKEFNCIEPFLQPLTPSHNKNVWGNCSIIISERGDDDLKPYLVELLEWLQDLNWPGAFCIFNRLQRFSDNCSMQIALNYCIEKAKRNNDEVWKNNLCMLSK